MQCANRANLLKKRSLEEEEPRSCRAKRLCLEAELLSAECPMETSLSFTVTNQQQQQMQVQVHPVQRGPPALCCPRCLGGEPGHINHIMRH